MNLHPQDLTDPVLHADDTLLASMASRVVLEVTERAALEGIPDVPSLIASLRARGFRVAIDDLGAGYAGLASFALLEPDIVKLDMSLVRDVHQSPVKQKLVRSMTQLCKDLGLLVVGEGVEVMEERAALIELGCDLLQGYCVARPGRPFPAIHW
jgi:EAL domain-containing protein (putative c-di-GMP-specific phosphodiesterase class I)